MVFSCFWILMLIIFDICDNNTCLTWILIRFVFLLLELGRGVIWPFIEVVDVTAFIIAQRSFFLEFGDIQNTTMVWLSYQKLLSYLSQSTILAFTKRMAPLQYSQLFIWVLLINIRFLVMVILLSELCPALLSLLQLAIDGFIKHFCCQTYQEARNKYMYRFRLC